MVWVLIVLGVLILLGVIAAIVAYKNKGKKHETDYYAFFVMGICFIPLGIIFMSTGNTAFSFFFILGLVYLAIGLANKDKWKKNHKPFSKLSKKEKKVKMIILGILILLVLVGLVVYLLV
jgi:hypothetical protein